MKNHAKLKKQRGIALLELMGALAIGSILVVGLSTMMDTSLEDLKGTQAAYYQSQIVGAANKYIAANVSVLQSMTMNSSTVVPVTLAQLKSGQYLSNSVAAVNVYQQTPCVLIRQPDPVSHPGQFDTLVITTGGQAIPDRDIAAIAMNAGPGSGYITAASPTKAMGGGWNLTTTAYRSVACSGGTALTGGNSDGGHLVSSIFYDGADQLSTDFLYRSAVPGNPQLNQMNTPILMASAALVSIGSSCLNSSGTAQAAIAIDSSTRALLTCESNGLWSSPSHWKEPVSTYAALPFSGSSPGDVRMVSGLSRAFTYDGGSWQALAVDQNGNMNVPGKVSAATLVASQSITSGGTIDSTDDITSGNNLNATKDVNSLNDVNLSHDVNVGRDVFAANGVSGFKWMSANHIQVWGVYSAGSTCHNGVFDPSNNTWYVDVEVGSMVTDIKNNPLFCNADYIFRYANGKLTPN